MILRSLNAYPHKTMSHLSMSPIEKDLKMLLPDLTSSCSILNSIAVADPFRLILCFLVSVKKKIERKFKINNQLN